MHKIKWRLIRLKDEVGDGYSEDEGQLYHTILAARIGMLTQVHAILHHFEFAEFIILSMCNTYHFEYTAFFITLGTRHSSSL